MPNAVSIADARQRGERPAWKVRKELVMPAGRTHNPATDKTAVQLLLPSVAGGARKNARNYP